MSLVAPLTTGYYVVAAHSRAIAWDQWAEVFWLERLYAGAANLSYLWQPHNDHIIIFPRLLYLIELGVFHGTNTFITAVSCLVLASAWLMYLFERDRTDEFTPAARHFLLGVYTALLLSAVQLESLITPAGLQTVMVYASVVWAIHAMATYRDRVRGSRATRRWLVLSLCCGSVATFSFANGILVWPLLVLIATTAWPQWRGAGVVAIHGSLIVALWWYLRPPAAGLLAATPLEVLGFLTLFLGAPLGRLSLEHAGAVGTLGLAAALALTAIYGRRLRDLPGFVLVHVCILWFVIGTGAVTALARKTLGPEAAVASRYATGALCFWSSLISLGAFEIIRLPRAPRLLGTTAAGLVIAAILVWGIPAHRATGQFFRAWAAANQRASLALRVGVRDGMLGNLYPDPDALLRVRPFVTAYGLGIFSHAWTDDLGRSVEEAFAIDHAGTVSGRFAVAEPVLGPYLSAGPHAGVRVHGWATETRTGSPVQRILIADSEGTVRGVAEHDPEMAARTGRRAGWFGFAAAPHNMLLTAFAVTRAERVVVPLPGVHFAGDLRDLTTALAPDQWQRDPTWTAIHRGGCGTAFGAGYAFSSCAPTGPGHGTLRSEPFPVGPSRYLLVPLLRGPQDAGLQLYVDDALTVTTLAADNLALRPPAWTAWTVDLTGITAQRLRIVAVDADSSPATWLIIGEPRLLAQESPGAAEGLPARGN